MMKKLFGLLILSAAFVLSACDKDQKENPPTIQFETNNAFLNAGTDLVVKVVLSKPATSELTIPYTLSGTAVKDTDYSIEESAFTVAAGAGEATVTLKHLNTSSDTKTLNITISPVDGYVLGNRSTCIISVGIHEDIIWSFAKNTETLMELSEVAVEISLQGQFSGNKFVAPSDISIPFVISSSSTALPSEYSVKDNATSFIVPAGSNKGSITLIAENFEDADPAKFIDLTLEPAVGYVEGDISAIKVTLAPFVKIKDIVGTWEYESFIITDDENAMLDMLEMLVDPEMGGSGDDLELLPKHNTKADKFTIALDGEEYKLTPSMTGDIGNYFRPATISGQTPVKYNFYYLDDSLTPNFDATECTLSSVNKNFSKTSEDLGEAKFKFYLTPDGNRLYVFITEYIPTDFLNLMYEYEDGAIYQLYPYLFDMGYTFTRAE